MKLFFKKYQNELNIFLRYILILILSLFFQSNLFINFIIGIYSNLIHFILNLFYNTFLFKNILQVGVNNIKIISSCIAFEAYILLTFFIFSVRNKFKNSVYVWLKVIGWFSLFNLIRILFLSIILIEFGKFYFDLIHIFFYEFLSGIVTFFILFYYFKTNKYFIHKKPLFDDLIFLSKKL